MLFTGPWLVKQFTVIFKFSDIPAIRLSSNLVSELIGGLSQPDLKPLIMLLWIPPFPGLWLVEQFQHIFRQIADRIELKFGEQTHWGPPLASWTFSHAPLNSHHFLASDCLGSFCPFTGSSIQTADPISTTNFNSLAPGRFEQKFR